MMTRKYHIEIMVSCRKYIIGEIEKQNLDPEVEKELIKQVKTALNNDFDANILAMFEGRKKQYGEII